MADTRIRVEDRREQILVVSSELFGQHGFAGTTTDRIAKAAGISQPYVVRMFGTKENLYLEVLDRARTALVHTLRSVITDPSPDPDLPLSRRLGQAYLTLVADRGILRVLMLSFLAGSDPVIGPAARAGLLEIFAILRDEAGLDHEQIVDFLAHGMLYNTILAAELTSFDDPAADELLLCVFGPKLDLVRRLTDQP